MCAQGVWEWTYCVSSLLIFTLGAVIPVSTLGLFFLTLDPNCNQEATKGPSGVLEGV